MAAAGVVGGQLVPIIQPPPTGNRRDHVEATPFATLYRSIFTIQAATEASRAGLLDRLKHVNCDYLSTKGRAPTLLELKQHAQSLVILIKSITVSTLPGLIDNANAGIVGGQQPTAFNDAETFDFLNDLTKPYTGPIEKTQMHHHIMPLTALMNIMGQTPKCRDGEPIEGPLENICPMHEVEPSAPNGKSLPYAHRQVLISHVNEILELLDHEYSAKGGILAILPEKNSKDPKEREQYVKSQSTLLGQMIQQHQRLVMRIHDLERIYANALDALAGEAVVPPQQLSKLGPDARKGRELVYPQDRFVLANCGEDVWDFLEYEFNKKENVDEAQRILYARSGVIGAEMWKRQGKDHERGITTLDITTRYIRLRKDPLKTIFIIPAHSAHPGTKATREMEKVPTVVSVVKPIWPERASVWEMKNREALKQLKKITDENARDKHQLEIAENAQKIMIESEKAQRILNKSLREKLNECLARNKPDETAAIAALTTERDELLAVKTANDTERARLAAEKATQDALKARNEAEERALRTERDNFAAQRQATIARDLAATQARMKSLQDLEAAAAVDAKSLVDRLQADWKEQLKETAVLLQLLKLRKVNLDTKLAGEDAAIAQGEKIGTTAFDAAVAAYMAARAGPGQTLDPNAPQHGMGNQPMQEVESDVDMEFM